MLSGMRHSDLDDLLLLNTVPHSLGLCATANATATASSGTKAGSDAVGSEWRVMQSDAHTCVQCTQLCVLK
eukprot:7995-Heterococcus_DN1.PRE.1